MCAHKCQTLSRWPKNVPEDGGAAATVGVMEPGGRSSCGRDSRKAGAGVAKSKKLSAKEKAQKQSILAGASQKMVSLHNAGAPPPCSPHLCHHSEDPYSKTNLIWVIFSFFSWLSWSNLATRRVFRVTEGFTNLFKDYIYIFIHTHTLYMGKKKTLCSTIQSALKKKLTPTQPGLIQHHIYRHIIYI